MTTLTDQRQLRNVVKKSPSATDNGIVRFDGTTGDIIQDSLATIDDTGFLLGPGVKYVEGSAPTPPSAGELIVYAKTDNKLYKMDSLGVEIEVGNNAIYPRNGISLLAAGSINIVHNFGVQLSATKILIRQGSAYLSEQQKAAIFAFSGGINNLNITNISGSTQVFDIVILGFRYQITTSDLDPDFNVSQIQDGYTGEHTGFEDKSTVSITYDPTTQVVTMTPVPNVGNLGTFAVWTKGIRHIFTGTQTFSPHAAVTGTYFATIDISGILNIGTSPFDFSQEASVALIKYDTTQSPLGWATTETHGITMDWATHQRLHTNPGTIKVSGGILTTATYAIKSSDPGVDALTAGNSALVDIQPGVDACTVADEDLRTTLAALIEATGYTTARKDWTTGRWIWSTAQTAPYYQTGNVQQYNPSSGGASLATMTDDSYLCTYLVAIPTDSSVNGQLFGFIWIPGQTQYTATSASASDRLIALNQALLEDPNTLDLSTLSVEYVIIGKVITNYNVLNTGNIYSTRIEGYQVVAGSRTTSALLSGVSPTVHNNMTGRSDANAHPASAISADVSLFNSLLTASETTVQLALNKIDDNAVVKAASSTDRAIAIFNGVSGQNIQNSLATIDTLGYIHTPAIDLIESISAPSTPSSGLFSFYTKNDTRLYTLSSAGVEEMIARVSDMPSNALALWSDCNHDITAATWQQTRTSYSDNLTVRDPLRWAYNFGTTPIQVETSSPLRGTRSYFVANALNNFIETPCFRVSPADSSSNLMLNFRLDLNDTSGNTTPFIKLIRYDSFGTYLSSMSATNSMQVGNRVTGFFKFNLGWNSTDYYSLFVFITSTTGNTYVDNIYVGPGVFSSADIMTDVSSFGNFLSGSLVTAQQVFNEINTSAVKKAPSATDNAIVRFDTTSGQNIQNSLATVSDLGYVGTPALALSAITTPVTPASGLLIYAKADNLLYKLDSSGNETPVGSGSGGGSVKVTSLDVTSTTLPTGSSVITDGRTGVNGDLVLFTNLSSNNNRVYLLGGVGSSITWTVQSTIFNNSPTPTIGDSVRVQYGTVYAGQLATYNGTIWTINDSIKMFTGTNFCELIALKTTTLTNNVTLQPIFTINTLGSENIIVDFSILRSTTKEVGSLHITQDGTNIGMVETGTRLADTGITLDTDITVTWPAYVASLSGSARSITFVDANTGWVSGTGGAINKTINGGLNWTAQSSGVSNWLYGINFATSSVGWAVGDSGRIVNTTNGGTNWSSQTSGTAENLRSVSAVSTSTCWVCGDNGKILNTVNGGTNWTDQSPGYSNSLQSIYCVNTTYGWAVGTTGMVLYTANGGTNWTAQTSNTTDILYGVHFFNTSVGVAVGLNGRVISTSNGGTTWTVRTSNTGNTLYSVRFVDANTVYACGLSGTLIKSTDAGATWAVQSPSPSGTLYSLTATDPTHIWAVDSSNNAYVYTNMMRLLYTSTNTGFAGTIKYSLKRWSDAAGGPTSAITYY